MRTLIVVTCDLPEPEDAAEVVRHLDPPSIPHFAGEVRVVVEPHATAVIEWLEGDDDRGAR